MNTSTFDYSALYMTPALLFAALLLQWSVSSKTHLRYPTIFFGNNKLLTFLPFRRPIFIEPTKFFGPRAKIVSFFSIIYLVLAILALFDSFGFDFLQNFSKTDIPRVLKVSGTLEAVHVGLAITALTTFCFYAANTANKENYSDIKYKLKGKILAPNELNANANIIDSLLQNPSSIETDDEILKSADISQKIREMVERDDFDVSKMREDTKNWEEMNKEKWR